ncbi:hypothetical protein MMC16_003126 [Acarospora aff. strigata]|nr:hypothetical protein [Acarospora aff. strigata]
MFMAPKRPLPLPEGFSEAETYIDALLDFITSSELCQKLCGGVHILDFLTREPDYYSIVLPPSWREWFCTRDIDLILDLLMREDLQQFAPRSAGDTPTREPLAVGDAGTMTRPGSWRGGRPPPDSLIDYIRDIRGLCLDRNSTSRTDGDEPSSKVQHERLSRHVTVGMKPKKIHEVENFARYVDDLASNLAHHNDTNITHLIDFGSGQNYLGRALASRPYSRDVVAIESKQLNIDGARSMDIRAKLAKKQRVMRNKREYRSNQNRSPAKPDGIINGLPSTEADLLTTKPIASGKNDALEIRGSEIVFNADQGKIIYIEQEIQNGDLTSVVDQVTGGWPTSSERSPSTSDRREQPDLSEMIEVDGVPNAKFLVISLHSCGNLLHHGIRSLVLNSSVAAVALVGCCYNLVTERLGPPSHMLPTLRSPNLRLNLTSSACDPHGFPMSDRLAAYEHKHGKGVRLNITARMMAVQAPQNWTSVDSEAFFRRHFFRALLQRILVDCGVVTHPVTADGTVPGSPRGWSGTDRPIVIGSLRKACYSSFKAYVRGAVEKLADDPIRGEMLKATLSCLTDAQLEDYEKRYQNKKKELSVVWSLMAFSAGVIESAIVIDRWLFLKEQREVQQCWVEAVFDYKQSPRNLVVVGVKWPSPN